eukprot:CAMPEP_0203706130 /NCGR_PEP_ID=MMETSP0091-20130426/51964_1 /ASSEMBLY_ACC=CAM_ASM_001089 /TAXON_ID=426623 /ORGANISM="Chaetoceros affinis, Strain CCMP159" /LENGTH=30 /DNA_ID= /DNA_START= /DNA_END= /DNA_ORIENTATION=
MANDIARRQASTDPFTESFGVALGSDSAAE